MINKLIKRYNESRLAFFGITFSEFVFNLYQKALQGHDLVKAFDLMIAYDTITND
ncbi:MAG: hypothetical protein ACTHMM_27010 [Agriterribacter sp.]